MINDLVKYILKRPSNVKYKISKLIVFTLLYLIVKTPTIKPDQYDCWYGKIEIELYSKTIPTNKYVKTSIEDGASEDRGSS